MSEIRRYQVGMSVEALASAWARTEEAPHGSVVVIEREISGRQRGGVPWTLGGDDALMLGMVVRPAISPMQEALLWLVVSLAASETLSSATGIDQLIQWPDTIGGAMTDSTVIDPSSEAVEGLRCSTNVTVQLGPGRVDHAVLVVRFGLEQTEIDREALIDGLRNELVTLSSLLETDALALVDRFTDRCSTIGNRIRVELIPRGDARGRASAVDPEGFLVLESPTGMLERVAPATLRRLTIVSD